VLCSGCPHIALTKTLEDNVFSWPESGGKKTEVQGSTEKEKQREQSSDRAEEKGEVKRQEEENAMEGVEKRSSSFFLVAHSVRTGAR